MNRDHGVAIITGGASGIGLAIAKAAVGEGWKVLLADLTQPALDAAKAQVDDPHRCVGKTGAVAIAGDGDAHMPAPRTATAEFVARPGIRHLDALIE